MNSENPYKNFSNYILRAPLYSFDKYKEFTSKNYISDDDFKSLLNDPIFNEALFLASPLLQEQSFKWLKGEIMDKTKANRLKFSLLKYFSRMSSRCTPFGLFAGCSVGKFEKSTLIELNGAKENLRHTRLDMNFLVAFSQDLTKNENIKKQMLFFPNSTIYKIGNNLRYIEYKYVKGKRHYQTVEIEANEYLETILRKTKQGALLTDLIELLVNENVSINDASKFIEEIVSSQLLVSELEPSVSGQEFIEQVLDVLKGLKGVDDIITKLETVKKELKILDRQMGNKPEQYIKIANLLQQFGTDFELKYMFQTDMTLSRQSNTINEDFIGKLKKGFTFLNKISSSTKSKLLTGFKNTFFYRFEEREISLPKALDPEIGVRYKPNEYLGDNNPLVDDIVLPKTQESKEYKRWTSTDMVFQTKILQAYKEKAYVIKLQDEDFDIKEISYDDLPDTISFMVEIVKIEGEEKIKFIGGGGGSAANLLGRFCLGNSEISSHTKNIINKESEINQDKILAEIVHLPESRIGNILMRPDFRKYEIPYLAKSNKSESYQLHLEDLMISIKNNNQFFLKSKKHDKEIKPYLTNAHNFAHNSLPVYHFLADMQSLGIKNSVRLNLEVFQEHYDFIPRMEYGDLILHHATWNLKKSHVALLEKSKNNDDILTSEIKSLRKNVQLPQFVMLSDGDNDLLINFKNLTSVRMLLTTIKGRSRFKLIEFLHEEGGIVKCDKEYHTNQIIVSFYNDGK